MSLLESYEREFRVLLEDLNRKIREIPDLNGGT